jgi:2-polyprenyl-3-methyl-5-hydroxy-6-metoxy-1,4-benzoquinol methylase
MIQKLRSRLGRVKGIYSVMIPGWFLRLLPYNSLTVSPASWDTEYANGRWTYMRQRTQLVRYSIIAGYCHSFKPGASILDIGCGEGILKEHLSPHLYTHYLGMDLSEQAISRAKALFEDDNHEFLVANMEQYEPDRSFDVIVFNECLYYASDPVSLVKKYERYLNDSGIFIISMYDILRSQILWTMLEDVYSNCHQVHYQNSDGGSWTIKICEIFENPSFAGVDDPAPLQGSDSRA